MALELISGGEDAFALAAHEGKDRGGGRQGSRERGLIDHVSGTAIQHPGPPSSHEYITLNNP